MAYTDFTLESAETELGLRAEPADLLPGLQPRTPPAWLPELLDRAHRMSLVTEKSRSEFLVAPVLLAVRELSGETISVLSGARFDVDPARKLTGECDFLLARAGAVPIVRPPLVAIVEAKKHDIELGLGQCMAQLAAARQFNDRAGVPPRPVWGCVTTGDLWQFLRLETDAAAVGLHPELLYLSDVGRLLAAFGRAVGEP